MSLLTRLRGVEIGGLNYRTEREYEVIHLFKNPSKGAAPDDILALFHGDTVLGLAVYEGLATFNTLEAKMMQYPTLDTKGRPKKGKWVSFSKYPIGPGLIDEITFIEELWGEKLMQARRRFKEVEDHHNRREGIEAD